MRNLLAGLLLAVFFVLPVYAATLSPQGPFRAFDENGDPCSGCKLYTYEAGTSDNKDTYTDAGGLTPNTNPVVLDSDGYADIWLGEGAYKYTLKDASDVTMWTLDNVTGDAVNSFGGAVVSTSTNLTVTSAHENNLIIGTSTLTLTLTAAATLGDFVFSAQNNGSGVITIDPDGSETINGASTLEVSAGDGAIVIGNGTTWYAITTKNGTEYADNVFRVQDNSDATKELAFELSGLTTATTRTITIPDQSGTMALTSDVPGLVNVLFPTGYIKGVLPSTGTDTEHDLDISAGYVISNDGTTSWEVGAQTKQFDATWSEGTAAGGLFNGSLATDTWYNIYAIYNPSTEDEDIGADTIANGISNLPSGYTKYQLVTSFLTDGSSNIVAMTWEELGIGERRAIFNVTQKDHDGNATTGSAGTIDMSVPTGRTVDALFRASINNAGAFAGIVFSTPTTQSDEAPGAAFANGNHSLMAASGGGSAGEFRVKTNTGGQINERAVNTNTNLDINTWGWIESLF